MWTADEGGRPRIPEGDPDPVPYKPLWGKVEVNPRKRNAEKEMLRLARALRRKALSSTELPSTFSTRGVAWLGMRGMLRRFPVSWNIGNESIERLLVRYPFNRTIYKRGSSQSQIGRGTTPGVVLRRMAQHTWRTIHPRTTRSPIHFAVRLRIDRGLTSTPTAMFYSRILSCAALVIITTSPCGWVML
jgi:hypothetical protein